MQSFVYEDGEFEVNPFSNLQPMELTKSLSLEVVISENCVAPTTIK